MSGKNSESFKEGWEERLFMLPNELEERPPRRVAYEIELGDSIKALENSKGYRMTDIELTQFVLELRISAIRCGRHSPHSLFEAFTKHYLDRMELFRDADNSATERSKKIAMPPGYYLLKAAEILISKERYEHDCMAAIADWHEEYFEALDQERSRLKMALIRIRHTWGIVKAVGLLSIFQAIGKIAEKLIGAGE